jgi:hypothetical protein
MKKLFLCALASLALLASCDKIEEGDYTTFAGAAGTWVNGEGVTDQSQRVLLEKYTGPRCVNCPTADVVITTAMGTFGNKLIPVAIHDSSYFGNPLADVDLRTDDGNTWSTSFGLLTAAKPLALLNRQKSGDVFIQYVPTGSMDGDIQSILSQSAKVAVAVEAGTANDTMTIDVNLQFLQNVSDALTLTLFIMEDSIVAPQEMPDGTENVNYIHNHVLRDVITDVWGNDVDADGKQGTKRFCRFKYTGMKSNWNLEHCHIVAFVSYKTSRSILNAAECEIEK